MMLLAVASTPGTKDTDVRRHRKGEVKQGWIAHLVESTGRKAP